jgi:hypothetical protein
MTGLSNTNPFERRSDVLDRCCRERLQKPYVPPQNVNFSSLLEHFQIDSCRFG